MQTNHFRSEKQGKPCKTGKGGSTGAEDNLALVRLSLITAASEAAVPVAEAPYNQRETR